MSSLVVFSPDVPRLAAFYEAVIDARPTSDSSNDIRLFNDRDEVLVHALPKAVATTLQISSPPTAREHAAIKPVTDAGDLTFVLVERRGEALAD